MNSTSLNGITIQSSGHSRSRIVLCSALGSFHFRPVRLQHTLWIAHNADVAAKLRNLFAGSTWRALADQIPGGLSSTTWQRIKNAGANESPRISTLADTKTVLYDFGAGSNRAILLNHPGEFISPVRFPGTSIIAMDELAYAHFAQLLHGLSGNTNTARDQLAPVLRLGGATIGAIRRHLKAATSPAL